MRVRPVSTMCRCQCLEYPLYSGVWGGVVICDIPWVARKDQGARFSAPLYVMVVVK